MDSNDRTERTDLDIPEETTIELGPGDQPPVSLDPDRDLAERNAASGGWDGANEQIENDFEIEQLRRGMAGGGSEGDVAADDLDAGGRDDDEDAATPLT